VKPVAVDHLGPDQLRIRWEDGRTFDYRARALRLACPCAGCIDEWNGSRLLDPAKIPPFLTLLAVELVGRYALNFTFSDGHHTGIFSWQLLRQLGEGTDAGAGPS
jgi:DUF971 family protein